jgi:hypothetical protein
MGKNDCEIMSDGLSLPNAVGEVAAQPGIAVDRFAREIVRILRASPSALAATECQSVGLLYYPLRP